MRTSIEWSVMLQALNKIFSISWTFQKKMMKFDWICFNPLFIATILFTQLFIASLHDYSKEKSSFFFKSTSQELNPRQSTHWLRAWPLYQRCLYLIQENQWYIFHFLTDWIQVITRLFQVMTEFYEYGMNRGYDIYITHWTLLYLTEPDRVKEKDSILGCHVYLLLS